MQHVNHNAAVNAGRAEIARLRALRKNKPFTNKPFGVGGCGGACGMSPPSPAAVTDAICRRLQQVQPVEAAGACYHRWGEEQLCATTMIPGFVTNVAGQGIYTVRIQPIRANYFLPLRAEILVTDNADFETPGLGLITAVTINGSPQECFDERAPTAATIGVPTSQYQSRDQRTPVGVPVRWGPFGKVADQKELVITGFNPLPAVGNPRDMWVTVVGYCVDELPSRWKCGVYPGDGALLDPGRPTMTPTVGSGNLTASGGTRPM
jgi:hypothetical protein